MSEQQSSDGAPTPNTELLESAELLVWSLLDEQITDEQVAELERMLGDSDEVRQRYLECVQLHVDLQQHFAEPAPADGDAAASGTPILSQLQQQHGFPGPLPTPRD